MLIAASTVVAVLLMYAVKFIALPVILALQWAFLAYLWHVEKARRDSNELKQWLGLLVVYQAEGEVDCYPENAVELMHDTLQSATRNQEEYRVKARRGVLPAEF